MADRGMLELHNSIPAIIATKKHYYISTDEKFFITHLNGHLLSITGKKYSELSKIPIQKLFIESPVLPENNSFEQLETANHPFCAEAGIQSLNGNKVDVLWVVTPLVNRKTNKVNGFTWTGCEINSETIYNNAAITGERSAFASFTPSGFKDKLSQQNAYTTITGILNCITDGFIALDADFAVTLWNPVAEKITGLKKNNVLGKYFWRQFPSLRRSSAYTALNAAFYNHTTINFEQYVPSVDRWFEASVYPYDLGVFIYFKDSTVRKKQQRLLAIEKKILEINVQPNATLKHTVDCLLEEIENIYPGMYCSVLSLDEYNKRMRHLSAPRLPAEYADAINGKPVGPNTSAYGAAMFSRKMVIMLDMAADTVGTRYHNVVLKLNLKSCWSNPVLNAQEEVIGCFSCYHTESATPSKEEIDLMERVVILLSTIIENKKAEEKVKISNDRYIHATHAAKEAIWDWDIKNDIFYWGEGFYNMFGYKTSYKIDTFKFWETHIHPDDRESVSCSLHNAIKQKSHDLWISEYRFKKSDGNYAIVVNRGYLIFDKNGETFKMIGSVEDVTEKKRVEKQLIKQEIDKQNLIAQAVLEAQEKEREKISKELHDNVNQVLSIAKMLLDVAKTNVKERSQLIQKSSEQIYHAINEITNISRALVPPSISDLGLIASIKDLLDQVTVSQKIKVEFKAEGDIENDINDNQKLMLFRIINQQVNNVLTHAEANKLSVQLLISELLIELMITDDGKGFDTEKLKNNNGTGLTDILSRCKLFNAKVNIISAPGKGCKLILKLNRIFKY